MKLIVLMSLADYKNQVRQLFEKHNIHVYSEVEIIGHTADTVKHYGWWSFEKDLPMYSIMYFAVIPANKAEEIFSEVKKLAKELDSKHPPRAFQIDVEKMV
ncbi:MAG: hypothetical protein D6813_09055 [Calditrichaeota bacterium]|nr:MAG: hypothetical protein D6813_09055 [Calditrichota bacterium]